MSDILNEIRINVIASRDAGLNQSQWEEAYSMHVPLLFNALLLACMKYTDYHNRASLEAIMNDFITVAQSLREDI